MGGGAFLTPFLHGLGREALSATTGESIKSLGGGPVAEFFGSLGSALGYDYLRGIQPQNITNYLRDKQTQRYQASKEVGKNLTVDTNVLRNELKEVSRDLTSTAPGVARKRIPAIEKELEIIQDISKGDAVNINKLVNQKQHINSLYDQETDANVKKYFARMAEDLQDAIQSSGNPEFLRDFNKAEDITRVLSQVNDSGDLISRVTRKLGNSIKSTALKTILNIPNFILSDVVTPEFPLLKLPDTRHYLRNIVTNSLLGKTGAVARNIKGLDKVLQKEEKKPSRFKVRPGKPENQRFTVRPPSS